MAAGSIPFPYRPGMSFPWATHVSGTATSISYPSIPGIMTLNWYPTLGRSENATDPASIVGKEIFAKVREKFSGSIDADAPDFVIYLMALDSVYSYIASLKRIYRILTAYTSENHYIPDAMLQALGLSSAGIVDLKEHRMQFFQIINELVVMTRKFNVPAVFDILNRHYWMNDNVYTDDNTINSQFYIFRCLGYLKYGLSGEDVKVGSLSMTDVIYPDTNVAEYMFSYGRTLINALADSDDAYIISGYLMRAYEGVPVFAVDELPIDNRLEPSYDPEILMQIENSLPLLFENSTRVLDLSVTQDPSTNAIISKPHVSGSIPTPFASDSWKLENFLSIRSDTPTVADVTISTRLKMGWDNMVWDMSKSSYDYDIVCGSEVLIDYAIWYYNTTSTGTRSLLNYKIGGLNWFTTATAYCCTSILDSTA